MMDLENFTLYFLLNDKTCNQVAERDLRGRMTDSCLSYSITIPECHILDCISSLIADYDSKAREMRKQASPSGTQQSRRNAESDIKRRLQMLRHFETNSFPLCNNPERVDKTLEALVANGTSAAAFITYAHAFQHNWGVVANIMKRRPDWKIANNFASKEKFGVEESSYYFSGGLHRRYRNRFEGRLKVLLSSGIYGLWRKWQRIRFSMSPVVSVMMRRNWKPGMERQETPCHLRIRPPGGSSWLSLWPG